MESELKAEIVEKRKKKRMVSCRWIRVRAKQLVRANYRGPRDFQASPCWLGAFLRRSRLSVRHKTNSKRRSVLERRELLLSWHRRLRLHLQHGTQQCPLYGRYDRLCRFNVDLYIIIHIITPSNVHRSATFPPKIRTGTST
eukprot:COSAG02_NODE_3495_length_6655_cov_15.683038_4_plen_141_part_00